MKIIITQCIFVVIYLSYFVLGRLNKISNNVKQIIHKDIYNEDLDENENDSFLEINNSLLHNPKVPAAKKPAEKKLNSTTKNTLNPGKPSEKNTTKEEAPKEKVKKESKNKEEFPLVVDTAPYLPVDCSQTVILKAKRLANDYDYAVKKDAFFTINPLRINIFDELNADSLINSMGMNGLEEHVNILKGSQNCLFFHEEVNRKHNITMCIDDKNTTHQMIEAFEFFSKCSPQKKNLLSKIDSLEILVNTLSNPKQKEYAIPNFKRAIADELTGQGFSVANSGSKIAKSNCKENARQVKFKRAKLLKRYLHVHKDGSKHLLGKPLPLVPGAPVPKGDEIRIGEHHHHHEASS